MSVFQFEKMQRVTVPLRLAGAANVQGVVIGGYAEIGQQPRYAIQWPNTDKVGDDGSLVMCRAALGQDELTAAQPAGAAIGALKVKIGVDTTDLDAALKKAQHLNQLTKRKRKPAAEAKSKSKRNR